MYIVIKSWFPTHLNPKVNEKYLEIIPKYPPNPDLGKLATPLASKATKKGIKTMAIYDVKEGKFDEASALLVELMSNFNDIAGYEWAFEVWAKAPET